MALLLVPRSIPRLKRAFMGRDPGWARRVEAQSRAVSRAVYFSSTSAGAMAGRWSAEPCRMVGSLTKSVFQP